MARLLILWFSILWSGPHNISYEETDTINFQNIIADKEKLQLRTAYGNRPIPCDEIIMPFFYKLQSNKR